MKRLLIAFFAFVMCSPLFARDTISDGQLERIKIMTAYYTNRMSDMNLFPQEKCPISYTVDSITSILSQRRLTQNIHITDCIMKSNPLSSEKLDVYAYYSYEIFSEPYFVSYARKDTARYRKLTYIMKSELQSYLEHLASTETSRVDTVALVDEVSQALEQRDIYSRSRIVVDSRLAYLVLALAGVALVVSLFLIVLIVRVKMKLKDMDVRMHHRKVSITNLGARVDLLEQKLKHLENKK